MAEIPIRSSAAYDHDSILHINRTTRNIRSAQNITSLNMPDNISPPRSREARTTQTAQTQTRTTQAQTAQTPSSRPNPAQERTAYAPPAQAQPAHSVPEIAVPPLVNRIRKGQKVPLDLSDTAGKIKVCLGWNTDHPACDIDVSAFILDADGKVPGDDWFVFYGQEYSPDKSVRFFSSGGPDRQYISLDLNRLNPSAQKIVFVLTINDALKNHLNFSMVRDAYVRILYADSTKELVSFRLTDYYPNVISMMICELYLYQGIWKCNAIGNGVARDLAGLCESYGVQLM